MLDDDRRPAAVSPAVLEALAGSAALACLLRSPSVWPESAWAPDALLCLAAVAATARCGFAPGLGSLLAATAAAVIAASHVAAEDAHASWAALASWARLGLAFTTAAALVLGGPFAPGRGAAARGAFARRFAWGWVLVGAAASLHAAWQVAVLYPRLLARAADVPGAVVAQIGLGRGSSVFLLPAHLAAFLAAAASLGLGLTVHASRRGDGRALVRAGACTSACGLGLAVAGSLGGTLLLFGGACVTVACCLSPRRWAVALVAALTVSAALGFASASRRADEIARENPGAARGENWRAAFALLRDAPVVGHGGGGFATEYPRVKRAGDNDVRHAHQAFLEAAAEHGAGLLVLLAALVGAAVRVALGGVPGRSEPVRAGIAGAAMVVLGHGAIDFGWSEAGWAAPAAMLLGVHLGSLSGRHHARRFAGRRLAGAAAIGLAVGVLVSDSLVRGRGEVLRRRARAVASDGRHAEALELLLRATRVDPTDSGAWSDAASARLALGSAAAPGAPPAVELARRAVEASPRRARHRDHLARALVREGRRVEALAEAAQAARLAPRRPEFAELRDAVLASLETAP